MSRAQIAFRLVALAALLFSMPQSSISQTSSESLTPVVVELFTSEGCSSCPPADALLRELDQAQPIPGEEIIALGEHVDYWDDLGWKDTFSAHEFTERQEAYARTLRVASPYTPQIVIDGTLQFVGNNRARAAQALKHAAGQPKISVRIAGLAWETGKVRAQISAEALPADAELFLALVLDHAQSQVLRGENGGHRLEHAAVVLNLTAAGKIEKGKAFTKEISLNANIAKGPQRLVAFIQEKHQGKILGAAMQELPGQNPSPSASN
jgi:hypothetical protein